MVRRVTQAGLDLIKRFEGFSAKIYICPGGYPTVGYGHVVKDRAAFQWPITQAQAERILAKDVQSAERAVLRYINVPLTDGQFAALVSFTFNLGPGALQRSTLRRKVNRQEHDEVPAEFHKWVYAKGRKLPGLIRRRAEEADLYAADAVVEVLPWLRAA